MLKYKINVRHWLWSVVESILVSNCHYSLSSLFRTIHHYLQLFVSIWNYSICHFSLLFATIQLLFATSCHHSRLTTCIRLCILDMDDLSHTIRDYSVSIRTIRDYVLFDFSRHLFRPSGHSTQERGLLRSFLVREACTRHQTEADWWRTSKDCWQLP